MSIYLVLELTNAQVLQVWFHVTQILHYELQSFLLLPPFLSICDFGKQNTQGNISKISHHSRVIDRSDRNPLTQPLERPSDLLYVMLAGCDWSILLLSVNNTYDRRKFWQRFRGCFVFESHASTKIVVLSVGPKKCCCVIQDKKTFPSAK